MDGLESKYHCRYNNWIWTGILWRSRFTWSVTYIILIILQLIRLPIAKEWVNTPVKDQGWLPLSGFGGISTRTGRKPIIAAVNGMSVGGGTEMVVNCDIAVASEDAKLVLPDVKVGLTVLGGALPRLVRTIGRQRATLMSLTGRPILARQALEWGLVSVIAKDPVEEAIRIATEIVENSPDALLATRDGLLMGWNGMGADEAGRYFVEKWWPCLQSGHNSKEGVNAFLERRKPRWVPSKL